MTKYRKKVLYNQIKRNLGEILKNLATQKKSRIEEVIREYIKNQEAVDKRIDQLKLF